MSKTKVFSMHLLLLVLLVSSCSRRQETFYEPGKGGVRIDLTTELPATRAELDTVANPLNVDNFKVEIINSKGVIFKRWNTYAEYKSGENAAFHMNAGGPYTLRATYGDSLASGWSAWFFKGEQVFEVQPQQTTELSVVCRMANIKVAVAYGDNLKAEYQDYTATVSNSRGRLVFEKDRAEAGYMPAGTLTVDMELTDASGKKWYFSSSEVSASAGDAITLNLDTKPAPQGSLGLTLNVDYTTNDKTVEVGITDAFLAAEKPELSLAGFDAESGVLSFVESNDPGEASVTLTWDPKASPIKSLKLKSKSAYFEKNGLPAEVDFCSISSTDRELLLNAGLLFPEMSGELTATMAKVQFDGLAPKLEYDDDEVSNTHTFIIEATDSKDNVVTRTVTIVPAQAYKTLSEIHPGNVWARRAYLTLSTDGDPSRLTVQVKESGTELWYTPEGTEYSVSDKTSAATVKGLKSNTVYAFRAVYNGFAAAESQEMTTETEQQVENAGFEEWSAFTHTFTALIPSKTLEWYRPYTDEASAWWDVNSRRTMNSYYSLAGAQNKRVFMTAAYESTQPYEGNRSAMLFTTYVYATEYEACAAGEIFIGRAANKNGKEGGGVHDSEGHAFENRPSALSFAYRYEPYGNETYYVEVVMKAEDGTVIGSVTDKSGSASSEWSRRKIDLNYTDLTKKAASIYISIKSSSSDNPGYTSRQIILADGKVYSDCNIGSILYIDDIELIYE